jgi:hypothetical protein
MSANTASAALTAILAKRITTMANFSARCSQPSGHSFLAVPLGFIEYQPRLAEEDWANKRASRFTAGAAGFLTLLAARRFPPPPWSVGEGDVVAGPRF